MHCLFTNKKCSCGYIWPCNNREKDNEILANDDEINIIDTQLAKRIHCIHIWNNSDTTEPDAYIN